jgi:hypothetical protein
MRAFLVQEQMAWSATFAEVLAARSSGALPIALGVVGYGSRGPTWRRRRGVAGVAPSSQWEVVGERLIRRRGGAPAISEVVDPPYNVAHACGDRAAADEVFRAGAREDAFADLCAEFGTRLLFVVAVVPEFCVELAFVRLRPEREPLVDDGRWVILGRQAGTGEETAVRLS